MALSVGLFLARVGGTCTFHKLGKTLRCTGFHDARLSNDSLDRNCRGAARAARNLVFFKSHYDFLFFSIVFTPAVCFNILFHAGATAAFGVYCPGLITSLVLYPPLFVAISRRAISEQLLTSRAALISFVIAGLVHAADLSRNVFQMW